MIQFDIKYKKDIIEGKLSVQTRDGRPVRIVCWDGPDESNPIYGFIDGYKDTFRWDEDGINDVEDYETDLFIATNSEDLDIYTFNSILENLNLKALLYKKEGDNSEYERWNGYVNWFKSKKDDILGKSKLSQPKFKVGDCIFSKNNPKIMYKIIQVGILNDIGTLDYECELINDCDSKGKHNFLEISKVDSWGELIQGSQTELDKVEEILTNAFVSVQGAGLEVCKSYSMSLSKTLYDIVREELLNTPEFEIFHEGFENGKKYKSEINN